MGAGGDSSFDLGELMKIGVMIFATDQTIPLHVLAPEVEARGIESLWVTEKTHVPVRRSTPWPGGDLPECYKRTCDPFVALAGAAATTTTLRLGTGVALLTLRDPIIAAKEIATLDWMSGGRVELGVGYGWNVEEHASHGVELGDAPSRLDEHLGLMQAIWSDSEASFTGRYVTLQPSWSWPKPIQPGGPPLHVGARATDAVFADIARWDAGWLPIEGYGNVTDQLPRLRAAFTAAGRDTRDVRVSVYSSGGDPDLLAEYRDHGIDRTIVALPAADADTVRYALDAVGAL